MENPNYKNENIDRKYLKAHSGLRKVFAAESPLNMVKNTLYFTSKALSVLEILKLLS